MAIAVIAPFLAFFIGWMIFEVPTSDAGIAQVARFTYATDEPVRPADLPAAAILATVRPKNANGEYINRVNVPLEAVPVHVRFAVLAAEDSTFYDNPGFDITGIARAIYNQLTGGVGGGSTITQQYIKVTTGQNDATLLRKYKEVVLAVKISREQPKDQILENYLNTIYFGRGAYGIQAASQAYFRKDVGLLSVSEGAMLAGIIQAPSRWDPANDPVGSVRRWTFVTDQMVDKRWLTPADRAGLAFPPPESWEVVRSAADVGLPGDDRYHIYTKAKAELAALGITEDQINTMGLTITTTVQRDRQDAAAAAVEEIVGADDPVLRVALVSVDPRTGAIVAYYGGSNGVGTDYTQSVRQPGSAFKPFVVSAALQHVPGFGIGKVYDGSSGQTFRDRSRPVNNSEGVSCGSCTVQTAMTQSINTVFYAIALEAGPDNVVDAAHQAGIGADLLRAAPGGAIALGDQEVRPVDMAGAYATFAAEGQRRDPYLVTRVEAADGQVLYDRGQSVTAAGPAEVPPQVARNVTESMINVAGSSGLALDGGRQVAAKTGTVQNPNISGQNKDAWTVGYTPSLSTAVWLGSDNSAAIKTPAGRPIYGAGFPGKIWQQYMNAALDGEPEEQFARFVPMGVAPGAEPTDPGTSGTSDRPQNGFPGIPGNDNPGNDNPDNNVDPGNQSDRNGNGNGNRDRGPIGGLIFPNQGLVAPASTGPAASPTVPAGRASSPALTFPPSPDPAPSAPPRPSSASGSPDG